MAIEGLVEHHLVRVQGDAQVLVARFVVATSVAVDQHGLRVIEDAVHAFGCRYKGRKIGSFGDIVCFSFDGIKNITSAEGGAVVTSDSEVAARVRDARLLGIRKYTKKNSAGRRVSDFDVTRQGFRYHLSNVHAAIGRVQLERFPREFAPKRVVLARRYRERLVEIPGIALLAADLGPIVPHIQPVRVLDGQRDGLRDTLEDAGIETGIHYKPNHLLDLFGGGEDQLPITMQLYRELLSLPLHPGMTVDDVDYVSDAVFTHLTR